MADVSGDIFDQLAAGQTPTSTPPPGTTPQAPMLPAAPPKPQGGGNDVFSQLAAGQTPEQINAGPPPTPKRGLDAVLDTMGGIGGTTGTVAGMIRGGMETASGLGKLAYSAAGGNVDDPRQAKFLKRMQEIGEGGTTPEEKSGKVLEGIAEWMGGEGALRGLSYAEKMKQMLPALNALEKWPVLAKAVQTAIEQGTIGGGQTLAKTGDPVEAVKGAVAAGVTGGVTEGALLKAKVLPDTIRGELTSKLREGKELLTDTARGIAKKHLGEVISMRAAREAGSSTVPQIGDLSGALKGVNSMPEMVDAINDAADDVWKPIDDLAGDQFRTARNEVRAANNKLYHAVGDEQVSAAQKEVDTANGRMNSLLDKMRPVVSGEDIEQAKHSFRYAQQVERLSQTVQDSLEGVSGTSARNMSYKGIDGQRLRQGLQRYERDLGTGTRGHDALAELLGREHLENLYKLADANLTAEGRLATNRIVAHAVSVLGTGGGPVRAFFGVTPHTAAGLGLYYGTKKLLEMAATEPAIARTLAEAVENSTAPKVAGRVLAGLVTQHFINNGQMKPEDQPKQEPTQ